MFDSKPRTILLLEDNKVLVGLCLYESLLRVSISADTKTILFDSFLYIYIYFYITKYLQ